MQRPAATSTVGPAYNFPYDKSVQWSFREHISPAIPANVATFVRAACVNGASGPMSVQTNISTGLNGNRFDCPAGASWVVLDLFAS